MVGGVCGPGGQEIPLEIYALLPGGGHQRALDGRSRWVSAGKIMPSMLYCVRTLILPGGGGGI